MKNLYCSNWLKIVSISLVVLGMGIAETAKAQERESYVILVSLDGYRYDYTRLYEPENLSRLIIDGVAAEALLPSYPSKTFPNHYTIATGMLPGSHGLVDNSFYDPVFDENYAINNRDAVQSAKWYAGTPIWVLAEQQGLRAASYFFVGTEAPIQGKHPSYYYPYSAEVSNLTRISKVFEWLSLPSEKRPRLITLYFSDMDDVGHRYGPSNSGKIAQTLNKLDKELGALIEGVKSFDLDIHLVFVSDHGMVDVPKGNLLDLDRIIEGVTGKVLNDGALAHVYLSDVRELESVKQQMEKQEPRIKVVQPSMEGYYGNSAEFSHRLGDLLIVPDLGYYLATPSDHIRYQNRSAVFGTDTFGEHGYGSKYPEMKGIFYAWGPRVKKGLVVPEFSNIHIYPFLCYLLGLTPPDEIQGDPNVLRDIVIE